MLLSNWFWNIYEKMDQLLVENTFDSFEEFLAVKKQYEKESNTILTLERSFKIKDGRKNACTLIYERAT